MAKYRILKKTYKNKTTYKVQKRFCLIFWEDTIFTTEFLPYMVNDDYRLIGLLHDSELNANAEIKFLRKIDEDKKLIKKEVLKA